MIALEFNNQNENNVNKMIYRQDISGLRALAVMPVILFHSGIDIFKGGYVGVDVFFAISGFLITSILLNQISTGTFSFVEFFTRRIRRLAPALLVMYLGIIILFSFIYPSFLFKDILTSIGFSMLFVSNIFFWNKGGYFSNDLELQPLLHTWSLSIEEQFYLFLPLLLLLIHKTTKSNKILFLVLFSATVISLCLAIYMAPPRGSYAAFYLLPTRAYELGFGCLLALLLYVKPDMKLRELKFVKEIGLLCILIPVFCYSKATPFPSFYALLPVIGACLVIFSNRESGMAYTLFTLTPIVYIGIISYSLYLWHWPVILFVKWFFLELNGVVELLLSLFVSFIIASLSYHYIENPFRSTTNIPDLKVRKLYLVASFSLFSAIFTLHNLSNEKIVDPGLIYETAYFKAIEPEHIRERCTNKIRESGEFQTCRLNSNLNEDSKRIFVWGDSHASALMPMFDAVSDQVDVEFALTSGCIPLIELQRTDLLQNCKNINGLIFEHILNNKYDLVVLAAAYNNYLNWGIIGDENSTYSHNIEKAEEAFREKNLKMLSSLEKSEIKFLMIAQPPRFNSDIPFDFLKQSIMTNSYEPISITLSDYEIQNESFYRSTPLRFQANIVDFTNKFCKNELCSSVSSTGDILYKDKHHMSNFLANALSQDIALILNEALFSSDAEQ